VFTALEYADGDGDVRWSVVSVDGASRDSGVLEPHRPGRGASRDVEPMATDTGGATAALERISIPQDALDRISQLVSPRSSVIISDEAASSETGNHTDFIVLLSGEPQGGIKIRHRSPEARLRYDWRRDRPVYWRSPFGGMFSNW
jgi:hypothetical protein